MIVNLGRKWRRTPEPGFPPKNPQVILDSSIDGQAWMYNSMNESDEYLVFYGETADITQ